MSNYSKTILFSLFFLFGLATPTPDGDFPPVPVPDLKHEIRQFMEQLQMFLDEGSLGGASKLTNAYIDYKSGFSAESGGSQNMFLNQVALDELDQFLYNEQYQYDQATVSITFKRPNPMLEYIDHNGSANGSSDDSNSTTTEAIPYPVSKGGGSASVPEGSKRGVVYYGSDATAPMKGSKGGDNNYYYGAGSLKNYYADYVPQTGSRYGSKGTKSRNPSRSPTQAPSASVYPSETPTISPTASQYPSSRPTFKGTKGSFSGQVAEGSSGSQWPSRSPTQTPTGAAYPGDHSTQAPTVSRYPSSRPTYHVHSKGDSGKGKGATTRPTSTRYPTFAPTETQHPTYSPTETYSPTVSQYPTTN